MAIAFRSQTSLGGTAASVSVILPSGAVQGDILVVDIVTAGATVSVVPSGWTAITNVQTGLTARLFAYWHLVGASDPGPWSFTLSASGAYSHICSCYSAVDTVTPLDVAATSLGSNTAGTSVIVPAVSPTHVNTMLHSGVGEGATNRTITMPTGMTTIVEVTVGRRQEAAWQAIAATGSTGTRTWTFSGSVVYNAYMVPLRAATTFPATMTVGTATATAAAGSVNLATSIVPAAQLGSPGNWAARAAHAVAVGGPYYVVIQDTSDNGIEVWKSLSGVSFAEQDSADSPVSNTAGASFDSFLHTDGFLYVAYNSSGTTTYRVRRFNTATDQWDAADVGAADIDTAVDNARPIRISVRSDGDVLVARYDGTNTRLSRYEGTSWASETGFQPNTYVNDLIVDAADRAWIFFSDAANNQFVYRSFDAANTFGTQTALDVTAHTTGAFRSSLGSLYDDAGTAKIVILMRDAAGEIDLYRGTLAGLTILSSPLITGAVSATTSPLSTSAAVTVAGAKFHALWAVANGIQRDQSDDIGTPAFTTDVDVLTGLSDTDPVPQWINDGTYYGIVYQNSGNLGLVWVNAPPAGLTGTMTVSAATATGAGQAVTLTSASVLTSGTATATGAAAAVALAGQARIGVTASTATAAAGASTFTAASRLTVSAATATATAQAVNLAAAQAAALVSGTATATAQAEAVTLKGQGALAVTAATSTAQAEAITFAAAARFTSGTATATADGQAITFDAAARLTVIAAPATAEAQNVTLGAGGAASLAVTPAAATATAGTVNFVAPATMSAGTATANAAANGNLTAAAKLTASATTATATAQAITFRGLAVLAASPALLTANTGASTLRGASRLMLDAAPASAAAFGDLLAGLPPPTGWITFTLAIEPAMTFAITIEPAMTFDTEIAPAVSMLVGVD